jgi:catechol 2,3-dioxygenase-like lactoylglutathione lyase family enzyme
VYAISSTLFNKTDVMLTQLIHSAVPVIATDDIQKTLSYYTNVLGFSFDFEYGNPVVYAGVKSGNVEIYFSYDPEFATAIKEQKLYPEIFIWVSDADALFKGQIAMGVEIIESIADRPWNVRQYVIKDINGYHLKFAQPL